MDIDKLKIALTEEAKKELKKIAADTELEIKNYRDKKDAELEQKKEKITERAEKLLQEKRTKILSKAKRIADNTLLLAQEKMAKRLYLSGLKQLSTLRDENYSNVFEALVKEVPLLKWEEVRVNPRDCLIAKDFFVEVKITPDKDITGGFILSAEGGKVIIINTFEKRWERLYTSLLPEMLKELYEHIANNKK